MPRRISAPTSIARRCGHDVIIDARHELLLLRLLMPLGADRSRLVVVRVGS